MTGGRALPGPGTLSRTVAPGARNGGAAAEWPAAGTAPGLSLRLAPDSRLGGWVTERDIQLLPHCVLSPLAQGHRTIPTAPWPQ